MKSEDISYLRLQNQHLSHSSFNKATDVVKSLGAVQAQDYAAAKWSIGLRLKNVHDEDVEKAFNEGHIIRTHVMRPTWHFLMPQDIRWMIRLTAPRVKAILAHYDRKLGLTDKLLSSCYQVIEKSLQGGKHLTRAQLADRLKDSGITAQGQLLGHIVSHAELEAIICSGPRLGKQFTYALLEERIGPVKKLENDEALARLVLKYFEGHGPAQLKDFSWWSGLSMKDCQKGIDSIKSQLGSETVENKKYFFSKNMKTTYAKDSMAFLLSIYDEFVISYRDRSALGGDRYTEKLLSMGNAFTSVLILEGKIAGTWKRIIKKNNVEVKISPLRKLNKNENELIEKASLLYGKFIGKAVT